MKTLQLIELILTSVLFADVVANLVEIWKPDLRLISAIISLFVWFIGGIRYFYLKNEMLKHKPSNDIK